VRRGTNSATAVDVFEKIFATLSLVALNAFFVAAEFAAVGARASRLKTLAETSLTSQMALRIKQRLDLFLSSCQFGVTVASLGLGAITEPAVASLISPLLSHWHIPTEEVYGLTFVIAMAVSTSLHIVIGEQAPKNWAISYSDWLLPVVSGPLIVFTYTFYPAIWLLNWTTNCILRLTGGKPSLDAEGGLPHTEEELRGLLAQAVAAGTIPKGHGTIVSSALDLGELKVRQIMVPRTRVDFLELGQPLGDVLRTVQKAAYTRLPLCDGDIDHVIGLVHMKDLFNHLKLVPGKLRFVEPGKADADAVAIADGKPGSAVHVIGTGDIDLKAIKRPVLFVPELTPVLKMLRQFQSTQVHLAIVVDEYGSTSGIVTLEDVLEEIVGEIRDEFDAEARVDFVALPDGVRVSGLFPLHELRERLNLPELENESVDTVGGYIIAQLGRWPRTGDVVEIGSYSAKVLSVQQRRVGQALMTPRPSAS
jgi:CBS domain containing-hemolysin-like protein